MQLSTCTGNIISRDSLSYELYKLKPLLLTLSRRSPAPPTPSPPPPPAPAQPSTPAREETPQDLEPWVPHKPAAAKKNPKPSTNRDPFVLYIDAARYLPDNASIVKVSFGSLNAKRYLI